MAKFLVNFNVLDLLIIIAICLAVYLVYMYLSKQNTNYTFNTNNAIYKNNKALSGNGPMPVKNSMTNNDLLSVGNARKSEKVPVSKEKLRAANKKGDHLLLDQSNVKAKENYICNKECPCDERTIGESLEDIRKQFLNPTKSFYGNVEKTRGVRLDEGFKATDGKEHSCSVKGIDEKVINKALGCDQKYNLNVNNVNNINKNNRAVNKNRTNNRNNNINNNRNNNRNNYN